ncbi:golvesin C-terminal-like domain-containing protein [Desmospora profundinema]|uniref:N-acetylmuramoyl-L-alanine amidase n=1 Tax=Desmospora profundinema TaxID=1571184 RepID=A0ABU1ITV7_9BACL|nr:N-acetylmuramoyl-L-alanine amidase [Desmospora profundinema]MDR6227200.1 hypothetical protein [Desmospora profundinema]
MNFARPKTVQVFFVSMLALFILFFFPFIPTNAQPQAIQTKATELHFKTPEDYSEGKAQNVNVEPKGKKGVLTPGGQGNSGEYISSPIPAEMEFTAVGVHWMDETPGQSKQKPNESVHLYLRVSDDGEDWTEWHEVHTEHIMGPDDEVSEETFSELIFETGRYMQFKVHMESNRGKKPRISDIKLTALNSKEDQETAKTDTQMVSLGSMIFDSVEAAVNRPDIVSRAGWGADESLRYIDGEEDWPRQYAESVTHLSVHHTDTPNTDESNGITPEERIRNIYYFHAKTRGWGDIGYNAIIGYNGKIYEGRKGKDDEVLTPGVVGAHTYSFNNGSFGVSMLGNFERADLPGHMQEALEELLAYQADLHGIDPMGKKDFVRNYEYDNPNIPKKDPDVPTLQGHKDFPRAYTACPGGFTHKKLNEIRQGVVSKLEGSNGTITIDNMDPANEAKGDWVTSTNVSGYYGSNYQASAGGWGFNLDTFTWNFELPEPGSYRVLVHYTSAFDRATNAPYEIHTKDEVITQRVNQKENGSTWVDIGTYEFNSGANKIVQTDDADGYVIADAIRLQKTADQPPADADPEESHTVIIDNKDSDTSFKGNWPSSKNVSGYYGSDYQPNAAGSGNDTFTWTLNPPKNGMYRVFVHYAAASDRASNAPYTVTYADGKTTYRIDQRKNGGKWVELGDFNFKQGTPGKVTLSDDADGYVIADAVKFELVPHAQIVDNTSPGNKAVGEWNSSNAIKDHYGTDYLWSRPGAGDTFTWNFNISKAGYYRVSEKHQPNQNRASNAPFTIHHSGGSTKQLIDQRAYSGQWVELGTFKFDEGAAKVVLSDDADGTLLADAIKIEPVPYTEVIDNKHPDTEAVGVWTSTNAIKRFVGTDYLWNRPGTGDTFTWNFNIPESGYYRISEKHQSNQNRASNAPFTIHHSGGTSKQLIDQRANSGQWVELGTFKFDKGAAKVVLSDDADGTLIADAIKIEKVPTTITSDNTDSGNKAVGEWNSTVGIKTFYGTDYFWNRPGTGQDSFTWNLGVPESGSYHLYVKHMANPNRATNAPFTIHHVGGPSTVNINQTQNNGKWVYVGTYNFEAGTAKVVLTDKADGTLIADAVRLVKQ